MMYGVLIKKYKLNRRLEDFLIIIRRNIIMGWIWKGTQAMDMERYIALKSEIKAFEQERITNNIMDYYRYHELYRLLYKLQTKLRKEGLL